MRFLFKNTERRPRPPGERCPFQPTCPFLSSWGPAWLAARSWQVEAGGGEVRPKGAAVLPTVLPALGEGVTDGRRRSCGPCDSGHRCGRLPQRAPWARAGRACPWGARPAPAPLQLSQLLLPQTCAQRKECQLFIS